MRYNELLCDMLEVYFCCYITWLLCVWYWMVDQVEWERGESGQDFLWGIALSDVVWRSLWTSLAKMSQMLYHKITFYMVNVSTVVVQFSCNTEIGADVFVDHYQRMK
jgi:hypothetical protein